MNIYFELSSCCFYKYTPEVSPGEGLTSLHQLARLGCKVVHVCAVHGDSDVIFHYSQSAHTLFLIHFS